MFKSFKKPSIQVFFNFIKIYVGRNVLEHFRQWRRRRLRGDQIAKRNLQTFLQKSSRSLPPKHWSQLVLRHSSRTRGTISASHPWVGRIFGGRKKSVSRFSKAGTSLEVYSRFWLGRYKGCFSKTFIFSKIGNFTDSQIIQ